MVGYAVAFGVGICRSEEWLCGCGVAGEFFVG